MYTDPNRIRATDPGNVNPEQIFNILEARIVDEYGNETDQRRIGPEAWNEVFRAQSICRVAATPELRFDPTLRRAQPRLLLLHPSRFRRPGGCVRCR